MMTCVKKIQMYCLFFIGIFGSACVFALTDPTRPYSHLASRPGVSGLILNSLLISDERKVAIINNQKVYIGDTIGSSVVADINDSGVLLRGRQGTQMLGLSQQPVKRTGF